MNVPRSLLNPLASLVIFSLLIYNHPTAASPATLTIVSQNLNRFYDDENNGYKEKIFSTKKYNKRINKLVDKISNEYKFADIIAFQEIENIKILHKVSHQLKRKFAKKYRPLLIEGNDVSGLDVGFLVNKHYQIKSMKSLFRHHTTAHSRESLFSRPPLLLKLCQDQCITIINVHLRSMIGLHSSKRRKRVSLKRRLQAETLARWIQNFQHQQPQQALIILGDFNALMPSDTYVDSLGTIIGSPNQQRPKWKSPDLIKNDLINASLKVNADKRFSYRYKKRNQLLDYLLVSRNFQHNIQSISYSRIDFKFSDHAAVKATIHLP